MPIAAHLRGSRVSGFANRRFEQPRKAVLAIVIDKPQGYD
jgi:hypothetical protein